MGRTGILGAAAPSAAVLIALLLAGCTPDAEPSPSPSGSASASPSASASDEPTAAPPELDPEGDAEENLAFFDFVNAETLAANGDPGGRGFIDGLVAAGFVKTDMEVTSDTSTIGSRTDSVQFSVRLGDTCLLGQFGNVGYVSEATGVLATGRCLIGATRPIDW